MIKAIVADDEKLARAELLFLLRAHQDIQVLAEARNGLEALELVDAHHPDLLFLDINMPGMTGLDVARKLVQGDKTRMPYVIFATAYDQYAVDAFEINAIDYLVKPVEKARLAQSLARVRKAIGDAADSTDGVENTLKDLVRSLQALPTNLAQGEEQTSASQQTKLMVRSSNRMLLISPRDLVFASVDQGRLWMVAGECEGESSFKSLDDLHAVLATSNFWRAHRSHLVNIDHIREIVPWFKSTYQIRMDDRKGTVIPVSRSQTRRLKELFNL